jgi:ribonuclease Z
MKSILGNDLVESILRVLSGGIGFIFLVLGLAFLILPEVVATAFFAETARAVGINSLRGDFGALFLGMSFFCLLGILSAHRWLLIVPIVFLALVILGRLTSFIVDDLPMVMAGTFVSELMFLTVLSLSLISYSLKSDSQSSPPVLKALYSTRFLVVLGIVIIMVAGALSARRQIGMSLWNRLATRQIVKQNVIGSLPDGLHVGLAGTGSPLPDAKRTGVCTFVLAGKHLFIIDSGPGSTLNLELMRVPLGNIQAVLLTHLHSDHIAGLGELMLKAWTGGVRTEPLKIIGPEGVDDVVHGFNQAFSPDAGFRFAHHGVSVAPPEGAGGSPETIELVDENKGAVVFQTDDLIVTAFLVDHRPVIPAFGFRFDYKGRSVVISGDTLPSESLRRQAKNVDLLLHEALQPDMLRVLNQASITSGRDVVVKVTSDILTYHTFPEEAARIAKDAGVRQLVLHHIIPPAPMAFFHSAFLGDSKKYYQGPITVGVDGMLFSMLPNSTTIKKKWLLQ